VICGACNQDRHPVIEGDQNGRFQYTCGNGECHAFIKLHERSEPSEKAATAESATRPAFEMTRAEPFTPLAAPTEARAVDDAVAVLTARLAHIEQALATMPSLKAERSKLRRMLAASQVKPVTVRPVITRASNGQVVGYALDTKAHQ
jgi:hypothetical protein